MQHWLCVCVCVRVCVRIIPCLAFIGSAQTRFWCSWWLGVYFRNGGISFNILKVVSFKWHGSNYNVKHLRVAFQKIHYKLLTLVVEHKYACVCVWESVCVVYSDSLSLSKSVSVSSAHSVFTSMLFHRICFPHPYSWYPACVCMFPFSKITTVHLHMTTNTLHFIMGWFHMPSSHCHQHLKSTSIGCRCRAGFWFIPPFSASAVITWCLCVCLCAALLPKLRKTKNSPRCSCHSNQRFAASGKL